MEIQLSEYDNDGPVDGSDNAPDRLNRDSFSKHLAEILILSPGEDCFTASLEGPWGYGKSSVMKMVKNHLRSMDNPPIIIDFNPWLVSDVGSLIQKFLVQFAAQLDIPDRPKELLEVSRELLAYSKLFDVVKFIPGAEPWASTFKSVFSAFGNATSKIGKLKELDLEGRKNRVQKSVAKLNKSFVVFIDDIDRLTPDEAFQVIKLSKAIADFNGTSFILAFDHDYLADAFKKYGIKNSHQYIEKVVQLRIPLPLITLEDLHEVSEELLSKLSNLNLTDKFSGDQDRLGYLYHQNIKYLIKTPRELKRVFNHLRFVLSQTQGEVCFTDLYILSVIAIKAPAIYDDIKNNPPAYIGDSFGYTIRTEEPKEVVKAAEKARTALIGKFPNYEQRHVTSLLKEIFPFISDSDYSSFSSDYDRAGRIASKERLYVAMHYQVPKSLLSENSIATFIQGNGNREEFLLKVIDDGVSSRLFDLLSNNKEEVLKNAKDILRSIFNVYLRSDLLKKESRKVLGGGRWGYFQTNYMAYKRSN